MARHKTADTVTGTRPRHAAWLAVAAALIGLLAPRPAHAGDPPQDSRQTGWLEGAELRGLMLLPDTGRATMVTITAYRGDTVSALAWDQPSGRARAITLRARDLVGFAWPGVVCEGPDRCTELWYRITRGAPDETTNTMPGRSSNRDVWLYQVEYAAAAKPAARDWINACDGSRGSRADAARGVLVRGRWAADGSWTSAGYTISCADGVLAKCIRSWGYKPWKSLRAEGHGQVSLQPLHLACVRAARADYCGDGTTHTYDGTFVDMFDRYGFNVPEPIEGHRDESAFDTGGALWVDAPRWPTAKRQGDRWRFATCTRPASRPRGATPLIYIRSATYLGRK